MVPKVAAGAGTRPNRNRERGARRGQDRPSASASLGLCGVGGDDQGPSSDVSRACSACSRWQTGESNTVQAWRAVLASRSKVRSSDAEFGWYGREHEQGLGEQLGFGHRTRAPVESLGHSARPPSSPAQPGQQHPELVPGLHRLAGRPREPAYRPSHCRSGSACDGASSMPGRVTSGMRSPWKSEPPVATSSSSRAIRSHAWDSTRP